MHVYHRALIFLTALPAIAHASPDNPIDPDRGYTAITIEPISLAESVPTGLNNLGVATGYDKPSSVFNRRAWVWSNGVGTQLTAPAGRFVTVPEDINDLGIIVGSSREIIDPTLFGTWWDETGTPNTTSNPDANLNAIADDPLSRFAGIEPSPMGVQPRLFFFGVGLPLPLLPDRDSGSPFGLNNAGSAVGWIDNPIPFAGGQAAFWEVAGTPVVTPFPGALSHAKDINESNTIVGFVRGGDGSSVTQSNGFLWTPGVGYRTLTPPPAEQWSHAEAVSPHDVAVGHASTGENAPLRGTVWDITTAFLLDDLTPARNDLEIGSAVAINAAGEILAAARRPDGPETQEVAVLLYPRNGRIEYTPVFPDSIGAPDPISITHGDFDGDGNQDLAATSSSSIVQIYLGNGDGTVRRSTDVITEHPSVDLDTADFNDDGIPDLLIAMGDGLGVSLGDGAGRFSPATGDYFFPASNTFDAKVIDYNGDQFPDAVTLRFFESQLQFYKGTSSGRLIPDFTRSTLTSPRELTVADFNGDAQPDIAVTHSTDGISLLYSAPGGTYEPSIVHVNPGDTNFGIAATDMNNDGQTDIVTVDNDGVRISINRNNTTFYPSRLYPELGFFSGSPTGLALTDMDLDGDPDIVAAARGAFSPIRTAYNRGSGVPIDVFEITPLFLTTDFRELVTPDMNNDGTPDIAVVDNDEGRILVILNDATPPADLPPGCNPADLALPYNILDLADINAFVSGFISQDPIADLNGDTLFDLADIGIFISAFLAGCP